VATVQDLTERELIARIERCLPPAPAWAVVGIGDDAAVLEPERNHLEVLSVDALVEGVHFDRRFTPPDAIGHRALAVNLSDLAAMGASPRAALLSLILPESLAVDDFDRMIGGVAALAAAHRLYVAGGNLTRSPGPLIVDVTVTGTARRRRLLTRRGARPGDEVYVTGAVGTAAAGLGMLRSGQPSDETCTRRYLYPEPRVRTGMLLARNRAATACIDLSDGLADGVHHLAALGGVGIAIDPRAVPVEPAARRWFESQGTDPLLSAVSAGDDYELLFTARPRRSRLVSRLQRDTPFTRIGVVTADPDVVFRDADGCCRPIPRGYSHFQQG
jgi:thiamine-monophosphate kinase